jgi:hypothetical protein
VQSISVAYRQPHAATSIRDRTEAARTYSSIRPSRAAWPARAARPMAISPSAGSARQLRGPYLGRIARNSTGSAVPSSPSRKPNPGPQGTRDPPPGSLVMMGSGVRVPPSALSQSRALAGLFVVLCQVDQAELVRTRLVGRVWAVPLTPSRAVTDRSPTALRPGSASTGACGSIDRVPTISRFYA